MKNAYESMLDVLTIGIFVASVAILFYSLVFTSYYATKLMIIEERIDNKLP